MAQGTLLLDLPITRMSNMLPGLQTAAVCLLGTAARARLPDVLPGIALWSPPNSSPPPGAQEQSTPSGAHGSLLSTPSSRREPASTTPPISLACRTGVPDTSHPSTVDSDLQQPCRNNPRPPPLTPARVPARPVLSATASAGTADASGVCTSSVVTPAHPRPCCPNRQQIGRYSCSGQVSVSRGFAEMPPPLHPATPALPGGRANVGWGRAGGSAEEGPPLGPHSVLSGAQLGYRALRALAGRTYLTAALREDIQASAVKKQTGVSLKYLLDFGTQPLERQMLLSARFLHAEIPIRLAHRLMDLNHLPPHLSDEPHVRRVKGWYTQSFSDFRTFPAIKDNMDVVRFTAMLKNAFRRHNNVVPAIAKGVEEYKRDLERTGESSQERESEIQHFLDTFFLSRIAIRFLAGHHISMFETLKPDHIGLVNTKCSPFMVASDAVSEARAMCFREYGSAPHVTVLGNSDLTMAYVPSHLHHMVFELVKNSLRAVQERFGDSEHEPPDIQVVVAEGLEDVTIKVSDQGGGIPRSGLQRIWTYLYTTARSPLPDVDIDDSNMPAVLAGYGCGLPLSRLYARYFGGDLQIISMEGYGTDAYLHLARLGNDEEPLPGAV